jgi:hypothetical protein
MAQRRACVLLCSRPDALSQDCRRRFEPGPLLFLDLLRCDRGRFQPHMPQTLAYRCARVVASARGAAAISRDPGEGVAAQNC